MMREAMGPRTTAAVFPPCNSGTLLLHCKQPHSPEREGTDTVLTAPGAPDLGFTCPNEIMLRLVQCFAFRGITCLGLTSDRCTSKLTAGSSVGRLGPYMSASSSPTRRPLLERVTARLAATVLFPTPPGPTYYLTVDTQGVKASNSVALTFTARHTNDVTNLRQRSILHRN
jgi:hypothetical protein